VQRAASYPRSRERRRAKTEQTKDAGAKSYANTTSPEDAGMRRFAAAYVPGLMTMSTITSASTRLSMRVNSMKRLTNGVAAALVGPPSSNA
jgi:hypothetical protein